MRKGAELVTSKRVNHVNLNYIVRQLNKCCEENGWHTYGDCPDEDICIKAYDKREGLGEVKCPSCKEIVPLTVSCSGCGHPLPKKYKKKRRRLNMYCPKCNTIMVRIVDVQGKVTYTCNACGHTIEVQRAFVVNF